MQSSKIIITTAVDRLNRILPLAANQHSLDAPLQRLHKAILHAYIDKGRTLNREEMTEYVDDLDKAVNILKEKDLVVFNSDEEPIGAYPFTMKERAHQVSVNNHNVHCMCAFDALAVSPMYNMPVKITSHCHVTNSPIAIEQHGLDALNQTDVYFGINWNAASANSCCADSLCTEMIFLKNGLVAENWLAEAPDQRQTFHLNDAIEFAARFFVPLLNE